MIPIEKLRAIKHIVVHDGCPDGIASAMILHNVLPAASVTFIQYDDLNHIAIEPQPGTIFCDFSPFYPKEPAEDASEEDKGKYRIVKAEAERKIRGWVEMDCIVLDHHKTQKDVVERFGALGVFADEKAEPGICGATLAYREVWKPIMDETYGQLTAPVAPAQYAKLRAEVEDFGVKAGIRDTWQKTSPRWREACEQAEALFFWPREELVEAPIGQWRDKLVIGPVVFDRKLRAAQHMIDNGWRFISDKGTRVHVIESLSKTSDAAEILGEEVDWLVGFGLRTDRDDAGQQFTKLIYSTRSKGSFDCAKIASAHGGGGHTKAAGFKYQKFDPEQTLNPYGLIKQILNDYEAKTDAAE